MAVLAVAVLVAAGTVVALFAGQDESDADSFKAFKGSYPTYSPTPTPVARYTPKGAPAGPLQRFTGRPSQIIGQVVDREARLAYPRLARPWAPIGVGDYTAGYEYLVQKPKFAWYATVGSHPLDRRLVPILTVGPQRLRGAAELTVALWGKGIGLTKLTRIAGRPMTVSGRQAWLAGYRATFTDSVSGITERIVVTVAVDVGKPLPSVLLAMVAKPKYAMLPDINTVVTSLRVAR
jgi:hypothetical protein